jgi:cytochrome c oxidase subunit II
MNELLRVLFYLPEQASTVAREVDALHFFVILLTIGGAFLVGATIAIFAVRRRRHGAELPRTPRPGRRGVEWRVEVGAIALLLTLFLSIGVVGFRQYVAMSTPPEDTLDVYVVGKQWMWSFAYPDGTASNGDLFVPVGAPVRLLMTSRDVIHSFFVPQFRVKQDVVPGRMTIAWFEVVAPGTYDIFCAEYCGLSHSAMRGRVIALPAEEYDDWRSRRGTDPVARVPGQPLLGVEVSEPTSSLAVIGERVAADRGCLRCHTLDGTPHLGPTWAGLYGSEVPLVDGSVVVADDAYLTESMMDPAAKLHRGYEPIMPSYLGMLPAGETAAIVELIHALGDRAPTGGEPLAPPSPGAVILPRSEAP